ncbi:hypothetical protein ACOMHN_016582 [Nucella lapillus]
MSSQSTIKESRTVITSSSSRGGSTIDVSGGGGGGGGVGSGDGESDFYYKSTIHPRSSAVQRASASMGGGGGAGGSYKRTVEISTGHIPGYATVSSGRVSEVKTTREQEKKDLRDLNERFANYIEKVRFLEAQNRKLALELEDLKGKWGKETSAIKVVYETELREAREVLEDTNKEKNRLEVKMQNMQEQLSNILKQ